MAKSYSTPGVYIEEKSAFPNSVVAVATAVPAFIGYTERAARGKKSLINKPTRITSFAEYVDLFGGAPKVTFEVAENETEGYELKVNANTRYNLYRSMQLFFANGGGPCYIISVGDYSGGIKASQLNDLENEGGLQTLLKEQEPTMVVIPDAVLLEQNDCYSLQQAVLQHCGSERNRVGIFDVYDGFKGRTLDEEDVVTSFRNGIGANFLQFGSAYYPWLNTTIVQPDEIGFDNISNIDMLQNVLNAEVDANVEAGALKEEKGAAIKAEIAKIGQDGEDQEAVANVLRAVSPTFNEMLSEMRDTMNVMPPSAAMAGVFTMVDDAIGVFKAPANVSVSSTVAPTVNLTSENQEDLNMPLNGKAVNAIRTFVGKGVLVWGARTLDGNSQDWRYINVRRTMIMLEQSIKMAAEPYVFQPNDANTWISIKSMISNFLRTQWQAGALVGNSEADAYSVDVGLGTTMTANDILDGYMKITVKVAISRPAEFIVITFQQQMQKS